ASGPWLAYGSVRAGVTAQTPDASGNGWRMIIRLGPRPGSIDAEAIYPGGQSGNPASPWYGNLAVRWRNGGYLLLPSAGAGATGSIPWGLLPRLNWETALKPRGWGGAGSYPPGGPSTA